MSKWPCDLPVETHPGILRLTERLQYIHAEESPLVSIPCPAFRTTGSIAYRD